MIYFSRLFKLSSIIRCYDKIHHEIGIQFHKMKFNILEIDSFFIGFLGIIRVLSYETKFQRKNSICYNKSEEIIIHSKLLL